MISRYGPTKTKSSIQITRLLNIVGAGNSSSEPRLDTVLVVWLTKRSGSDSFFRQRFSSIWSRYSSSCCMGRFLLSFPHSGPPSDTKAEAYSVSLTNLWGSSFWDIIIKLQSLNPPEPEKTPNMSKSRWTCRGDSSTIIVLICPSTSNWKTKILL